MKTLFNVAFCFIIVIFTSCNRESGQIPEHNLVQEADNIALYQHEGYEEVVIFNSEGKEVARYVLNPGKEDLKTKIKKGATEIKVPLKNLVLDSEVYSGALEELNSDSLISGMFDAAFVTSENLKEKIKEGKIANLGSTSSANLEKIISLAPEAMLISYFDGMQTQNLEIADIPVIKMYDLQEPTPLGRAEWIRFIGRLIGQGEKADSIYNDVKTKYKNIAAAQKGKNNKPKVITDLLYQGVWYVPGGKSYQAKMIKDGGGEYFKSSDRTPVTLNLTSEQAIADGGDADIWIIRHYGDEKELKQILESDPLYREIKAYKNGKVYYSDTSKSGLFREFPFHPELLLNDYRIIFGGKTGENPRYFRQLK